MGDIYRKLFYTVPRLDYLCNIPGKEPAECGQYRSHMVPGTRRVYMPLQRPAIDSTSEMSHMSLPLPLRHLKRRFLNQDLKRKEKNKNLTYNWKLDYPLNGVNIYHISCLMTLKVIIYSGILSSG